MSAILPLERELMRKLGQCIGDHQLIADGDRIMVCMSGGKDSYTLLELLIRSRTRAPIHFDLIAFHLDQGHPGYDGTPLETWLRTKDVAYEIVHEDTYTIVTKNIPEGKTYCSLCSRLRRGVLYTQAERLGCNKIALGHHRDDAIETLLLNMMFTGSIGAMPAKLNAKQGRHTVIRPMLYIAEPDIAAYAQLQEFPILPCDLCGSQPELWRKKIKKMLSELEQTIPGVRESLLAALGNVRSTHLMDKTLINQESSEALANALTQMASIGIGAGKRQLPLVDKHDEEI